MRRLLRTNLLFYLLLFGCAMTSSLHAQSSGFTDGWKPFYSDGKWGYNDAEGKERIDARLVYDFCYPFSEGVAFVYMGQGCYFIDSTGLPVFQKPFVNATGFASGFAAVQFVADGKWQYINRKGKIYPGEFEDGWTFQDGAAIVLKDGLFYFMDTTFHFLFGRGFEYAEQFSENYAVVKEKGSQGYSFINKRGKNIFPHSFRDAFPFNYGMAPVVDSLGNYVLIDTTGKVVRTLSFTMQSIVDEDSRCRSVFVHGMGAVKDIGTDLCYFVNERYEKVSIDYADAGIFSDDGISWVQLRSGEYCYIDTAFHLLFEKTFLDVSEDIETVMWVQTKDSTWRLMDDEGRFIPEVSYRTRPEFYCRLAVEKTGEEYWFVNLTGEKVIGPFAWAGDFSDDSRLAPVKDKDNRRYFIDGDGGEYGKEENWSFISGFNQGYAVVGKNGKEWFVDGGMKNVFVTTYDAADSFNDNGYAKVCSNRKWGLIDTSGKIVIPLRYTKREDCPEIPPAK